VVDRRKRSRRRGDRLEKMILRIRARRMMMMRSHLTLFSIPHLTSPMMRIVVALVKQKIRAIRDQILLLRMVAARNA
jgi:hypothetical protein